MSIAVMNWVWAHSPTSGNERLVLLALADACSRDDGTGCWPSAATIARKANISTRSVRRVIARLETGGHLLVHRGGGRAGSTNSYTVVTGDQVVHSPGQDVTPDDLSGGDTGDRPPRTRLCQGTPDTAVSPDPPVNPKGTTTVRGRTRAGATRPGGQAETAPAGVFFAELAARSGRWELTAAQRRRLAPSVAAALAAGWSPGDLAKVAGTSTGGVRNPAAVLAARLSPDELPSPPWRHLARPPWCGQCDERTRMTGFDSDKPGPCPRCRPPAGVDSGQGSRSADRPHLNGGQAWTG